APSERHNSLLDAETMFQVATIVGNLLQDTIASRAADNGQHAASGTFSATVIVAGQIKGMEPRLFMIYPEGNFIEASFDTPFFQIGETKYGRPILIRGYDPAMTFEAAVKLMTVSFDSTLKANLSVGLPLDLLVIERDHFAPHHERRIDAADPYFQAVSTGWGEALKQALDALPDYRMDPDPQNAAE
ncbi:MAG: peptidase, partial [Novosphingobium sp.]